jgi:ubiquinol-cytochrome c reductase cytochrome b subunit
MNALFDWLDDRTGHRALIREALYENVPGGSRWRYVWGSTLVFTFTVQLITGMFLWMSYSPSAQTAWESVYYIQFEMSGGWLLRGIHHFTAQAMIVLLVLHLYQVVIDGAYKAPREVNFWVGLILMQFVLGLSLTGYLLPWDEKGYWATRVATSIMSTIPFIGEDIQRLAVGGPEYGHHTLTRFFALHAGVLPALLVAFLAVHIYVFRRHGLHAKVPKRNLDGTFWPDQVFKDAAVCFVVLAVVVGLSIGLRAELGAPADPAKEYSAARPEWYFLFLFQFLKFFPGETLEFVGAVVIPGLVMLVMFLMPIVGRWELGHRFNVVFTIGLLLGAIALTGWAYYADMVKKEYRVAVQEAHENGLRAQQLAARGIPLEGMISVMRSDPKSQGPYLFKQHCVQCHSFVDSKSDGMSPEKPTAPNLYGFSRPDWVEGVLDPKRITTSHYFGGPDMPEALKTGAMVDFVTNTFKDVPKADVQKIVAALQAESGKPLAPEHQPLVAEGIKLIGQHCIDCHKFQDQGGLGSAPDLTGYRNREWVIGMISNPDHERFYAHLGEEDQQMPAFAKDPNQPDANILTSMEVGLLADWLREDWYEPEGTGEATVAEAAK